MNYNSNLNSNSDFDMIDKSMFNNSFIINCLTFNSIWKYKFDQNLTDLKTFMGSKQKLCLMMNMYNTQFYYTEDEKNQVIEIPYKDNNYVFGIILPKKQSTPECSEEQFNKYFNKLKLEPIEYLSIPKFNERKNYKLNNIFKKLNINSIFENCNLSHINDKITIDYVLHQINFSIDETGYKRPKIINNQKNIQFDANKIFLYYVRNLPLNKIMLTGIFS
jgi:serine protease inhibitor